MFIVIRYKTLHNFEDGTDDKNTQKHTKETRYKGNLIH